MRYWLPSFFTCINLFFGCVAAVLIYDNQYLEGVTFLFFAGFFDFLDGWLARRWQSTSALGKYLDSLADMISFGFVPGLAYYKILQHYFGDNYLALIAFIYTVCAALRLARFSSSEEKNIFIGLATPAAAVYSLGILLVLDGHQEMWKNLISNLPFMLFSLFMISFLMISNVKMFSLKMSSWRWRSNKLQWLFLITSLLLITIFGFASFSLIIIFYIGLSLIFVQQKMIRADEISS